MHGLDSGFPARVKAVLGPTNTGKTHLAIERMLAHASGIIGFPLRLLARENYDRMVARKGARYVALITGEEKIVPPEARWFSCTVEAMPLDRQAEFRSGRGHPTSCDRTSCDPTWPEGRVLVTTCKIGTRDWAPCPPEAQP